MPHVPVMGLVGIGMENGSTDLTAHLADGANSRILINSGGELDNGSLAYGHRSAQGRSSHDGGIFANINRSFTSVQYASGFYFGPSFDDNIIPVFKSRL